jgi:Carboxypeptidase regulatory-like domain
MKVAKPPRLLLSKTNAVLSIFTLAFISTASGQIVTKVIEPERKANSVAGAVTDQRGDPVRGATVSLIEPAGENPKPALTGENGSFVIPADAGTFDLELSAPGFATMTVHGDLGRNQQLDLGKLALTIQTATVEVRVSVSKEELAEEQIKVEEQQRILGVIPNFFVT